MAKTKKFITKRIKFTKTGKIMKRSAGLNHFLAKKSRSKQLLKKSWSAMSDANHKTIKEMVNR